VLGSAPEYALCGLGLIASLWSWRRGLAPGRVPAAAAFLIVAGTFLLTQNTQVRSVPLATVIAFVLYATLVQSAAGRPADVRGLLVALLVYPVLSTAADGATIADYYRAAIDRDGLHIVERSNVQGVAIPFVDDGGRTPAQVEYLDSVVDGIALLQGRTLDGPVVNLDRVNPFPFALGLVPARGGDLFGETYKPPRPADEVFGDAAHVLIPKQPTSRRLTALMLEHYRSYLAEQFPVREEYPHWTLLSRR
jgi:hypothetical protein